MMLCRVVPIIVPCARLEAFVSMLRTVGILSGQVHARQGPTTLYKASEIAVYNLRDQGVGGSNPLSPTILSFWPF
jgi:hypothetical protein